MVEIRLYNTLTRKRERFKPLKKGRVGIYSCGPTVYWNQHIGHMYAYVQWDCLVRALKYLGYKVKWVMNITDVGHLTSDQDTGEDKMEKGARREGLTVWEIADKYLKQFQESLKILNIQKPNVLCRATGHIQEQIELIKRIEKNGFTYRTRTGLVFNTSKFPDYSRFARLNLKKQEAGARVEVDPEKKRPWDFLLWVTNQPGHIMQWESPWGRGFPGWHVECTAMSTKYLGRRFDIHTGGKEHISVHHSNEIAQAFGAFGKQTVNYWLHNEWLVFEGKKMSKSLGNMVLASDLVGRGFEPLSLRYLILTSHYRQGLNFTWRGLKGAQTAFNKLRERTKEFQKKKSKRQINKEYKFKEQINKEYQQRFAEFLADDLNFPRCLALAWKAVRDRELSDNEKYWLLADFDRVFGLNLCEARLRTRLVVPAKVENLAELREKLRQEKKWAEADKIRTKIERLGFKIEDTETGPKLFKAVP